MQIESVALNKIIPYIRNPRKNENAVEKVASSIKEFGFRQPIVVDAENVIIAGHTRFEAAKRLGLDVVPIHVADGLTEQQAKAYRIADNRVGQEAEWDYDLLKLELEELDNPELTGFDEDELNGILAEVGEGMASEEGLTDPDEVPEAPEVPFTVSGDLWELGYHRVLCGDATKAEEVERLMDGSKADMVFTDPPYGIAMQRSGRIKGDASMGEAENIIALAVDNIYITSKTDSAWYIWVGFRAYAFASKCVSKYKKVSNCIVWKKPSIGMGHKGYRFQHELCVFSGEVENRSMSDVWEFGRDASGIHPTIKPVDLVSYGLSNSTKSEDIVLDPFLGSGSTLIACQKTGRKCYGMEIDPQYCDVIITRWSEFTGKDDLLLNGKPFKWSERKIKKAA